MDKKVWEPLFYGHVRRGGRVPVFSHRTNTQSSVHGGVCGQTSPATCNRREKAVLQIIRSSTVESKQVLKNRGRRILPYLTSPPPPPPPRTQTAHQLLPFVPTVVFRLSSGTRQMHSRPPQNRQWAGDTLSPWHVMFHVRKSVINISSSLGL